uniref:Cupin domain-containing protein n=1 Tax=Bosea sp. NBC_00436 TaxID=2969620 RepID=A0A9E8A9R2_9HYPH
MQVLSLYEINASWRALPVNRDMRFAETSAVAGRGIGAGQATTERFAEAFPSGKYCQYNFPEAARNRQSLRTGHCMGNVGLMEIDLLQERREAARLLALGSQIRQLRHSRGLTMEQLAARIGRSVGYVSKVERDLLSPSLKDLVGFSVALDVQMSWFLDRGPGNAEEDGVIVRRHERRSHERDGIVTELLSPFMGGELEFMRSTYAPGAETKERIAAHKSREEGLILKGQLELWVAGRKYVLHEGDTYSCECVLPHFTRNFGTTQTVLIWVITSARS